MRKATWIPLIIIIIGLCLALAGFAIGGVKVATGGLKGFWADRDGIHSGSDRGRLVKVDESYKGFKDIELNADFFDQVTFKEGDGYAVQGQNYERYGGLKVRLDGDKLTIDSKREGRWINIGIDFLNWDEKDCWLEITYPKGAKFGSVRADMDAGRLNVSGFTCDDLYIDNDFGKVEVSAISCEFLTLIANSGDVRLSDIDVKKDATIDNDFGNVSLTEFDADVLRTKLNAGNANIKGVSADTIDIKNDFGRIDIDDVTADMLTLKLNSGDLSADSIKTKDLFIDSDFGLIRIDLLDLSGNGEIEQDSGDVRVGMNMDEDDLSYEIYTDAGSISVDGKKFTGSVVNHSAGKDASLIINSNFGKVTLKFLK